MSSPPAPPSQPEARAKAPARATLLHARRVARPHGIEAATVTLDGPLIGRVSPGGPDAPVPNELLVRLDHGLLAPGFVDLQVNGYAGVDLAVADADGWRRVTTALVAGGVTSFLPTFISGPLDALATALVETAEHIRAGASTGARALGVHLEGPFLSGRYRGAHDEQWLCDPSEADIERLLSAAPGVLRLVTLAPERSGMSGAIAQLTAAAVVVSVGHSDATAAQMSAAADAGARLVTHLFNAQRPLHHREPGVVGQALTDVRFTSSLIADLRHVAPQVCRLAFAAAPGRIALISDSVAAAGVPPGRYSLGGRPVVLTDDGPPLREDGTVAGSALRLDAAVRAVAGLGVDLHSVLAAATRVPADVLGRPDLGRLAPGARADLVWLSDDLEVLAVWRDGRLVHDASGRPPGWSDRAGDDQRQESR